MSRQELAERVNAWIFQATDQIVDLDANYVGKLERGVIRWPSRAYRQAFRMVLGAEVDDQLGFYCDRRRSDTVGNVDRQQFLRVAGVTATLPWLDLFTPATPTPVPARVTPLEIEQVRTAASVFSSWDYTFGGGLARETVSAQLRWSAQLLHTGCEERLRPALFSAVAELGEVAGFMAFDACAHEDGRRLFQFALSCAEQAQDWHIRAMVLSAMARQAVWVDEPDKALTHVELALVRSDRLTATERAMLHAVKARALAKLHRPQEALTSVGLADEAFSHRQPAVDPKWMAFYYTAQHHGDTGNALFDLSIQGRQTQADQRLAYSATHHLDGYTRSRALSKTKLASLLMATGDPDHAASIGGEALDSAGALRSRRALHEVWELHRYAGRHPKVQKAVQLREHIGAVLGDKRA